MKSKLTRNGFTIVELVIVIAVIAILAAVLIPTFSSLIQKAKQSADTQNLRNINTAISLDKALDANYSMSDAIKTTYSAGYNLIPKDDSHCFVFNKETKAFEYLEKTAAASLGAEYEKITFVSSASEVESAATNGGIVYLQNSITLSDNHYFDVKKDLVVIGDGKTTITSSGTSTIQTTTFDKTDPIFVMQTENTSLGLYGLSLTGNLSTSAAGIVSTICDNVEITISDCNLSNSSYAINIRNSKGPKDGWSLDKDADAWHGDNVVVNVSNSRIEGGTALNWKRVSGSATFTNCELICTFAATSTDSFTTISDEGYNNTITLNNCTVSADGYNSHASVQWGAKDSTVEFKDCVFSGKGMDVAIDDNGDYSGKSSALSGNKIIINGSVYCEGN